jgi:hypothetical protein
MFPLRDNVPSRHAPLLTWTLVVANPARLRLAADALGGAGAPAFLPFRHRAGAFHGRGVGGAGRISGWGSVRVRHQHVPARRALPSRLQHVVAVDLRRQRRGPHGALPLPRLLPGLRSGGGRVALVDASDLHDSDGGRLGRHRRRAGRLPAMVSGGQGADARPRLLLPAPGRPAGGRLPRLLVRQPALQRRPRARLAGERRGRRLVGAHRGFVAGMLLCGVFARRGREQIPGPVRHYLLPRTVARRLPPSGWP